MTRDEGDAADGRFPTASISRFHNHTGFDTTGADPHSSGLPVFDRSHFLKIRIPAFLGLVMGMAHIVPHLWSFTANFTYLCHK